MPPTTSPLTGAVYAAALLLLATGTPKLVRPDATAAALVQAGALRGARPLARAIGAAELVIAGAVLGAGGAIPAACLAAAYAGFTAFVMLALRRPERIRTCGCAGDAPPTVAHAVVNAGFACAALAAALSGAVPSVPALLSQAGAEGAVLIGYAGILAMLAWAVITVLPLARRAPAVSRRER